MLSNLSSVFVILSSAELNLHENTLHVNIYCFCRAGGVFKLSVEGWLEAQEKEDPEAGVLKGPLEEDENFPVICNIF